MPVYRVPVSLSYAGPGSPGVNVLHIRTAGVPLEGDTERENAMVAIRNFYASTSLLYHASTVIRFPTELVDVEDNEIVSVAARNEISGAGTATVMLPPASCICVSWKSSSATRAGRGRTFLGGLSSTVLDANGGIRSQNRTSTLAAAQALIDASTSAEGWSLAVYSRTQQVARDVVGATIGTQFASLRSRRD